MQSKQPLSAKWVAMLTIVSHHPLLLPKDQSSYFKKIFLKRIIAENVLIFLLQYIGLMFSTLTPSPYPVWFASGTACAFIFMRGPSILTGIWFGTCAAFMLMHFSLQTACVWATLLTLQTLSVRWLCYTFINPTLIFHTRLSFIKFIVGSTFITGLICSGLLAYTTQHFNPSIWLQWWLADLNGILIIATALIGWDTYFPQLYKIKLLNKPLLAAVVISGLTLLLFGLITTQPATCALACIATLIFILFLSFTYGWGGVLSATFSAAILLSLAVNLAPSIFIFQPPALHSTTWLKMVFFQATLLLSTLLGLFFSIKD